MIKENEFRYLNIALGLLVVLDLIIWLAILFPAKADPPAGGLELYFLDVGQGDSSLVVFAPPAGGQAGGVKMLIDGGKPNGLLAKNLEKIFPMQYRYLDLIIISHPQLDHFGGLIEILKNFKVGAVLTSNQVSEQAAWQELERVIKEKKIPRIILSAGDRIKYQNSYLDILSPRTSDFAKDINDMSIAAILNAGGLKAFFGGDISAEKEKELAGLYDLDVDVLKVSHHGSKFSSDNAFLKEVSPLVSVIGVGKNSYGHPTKEALSRLANFNSQIYRTDKNGLIKLAVDDGRLKMYTAK